MLAAMRLSSARSKEATCAVLRGLQPLAVIDEEPVKFRLAAKAALVDARLPLSVGEGPP